MDFCHGGGEQGDELESVSHSVGAGEGVQAVPQYFLLFPVLGGGQELLTPHLDPTALQEVTLSHRAIPATVGGDLRKFSNIEPLQII